MVKKRKSSTRDNKTFPPQARLDVKRLNRIDEQFRELGYIVESHGETGRTVHPPGTSVYLPEGKAGSGAIQRLIYNIHCRLRSEVTTKDDIKRKLEEYDIIIEELTRYFRMQGPLRPQDYGTFFRAFNPLNRFREIVEQVGPPLICQECGKGLRGRQRVFCSPLCRQSFKIRRQRRLHPEYKLRRKD